MTDKKSDITVSPQGGMIHNMVTRAKLVLRLLADNRVSVWAKFVPIGALIYVVSPIDLIMGIPGLDAIDDAAVVGLGYYFFIELCPPAVVQEHLNALENKPVKNSDDEIIDAESTDVKEE